MSRLLVITMQGNSMKIGLILYCVRNINKKEKFCMFSTDAFVFSLCVSVVRLADSPAVGPAHLVG